MKLGVITQARMTSTRLPGKVLLTAGGRTMLDHHVTRLTRAGLPVYVATTTNATDDPIVAEAERLGVPTFRGSEQDVLARFIGAIDEYGLETVVRVTSDCPLIDGRLVADGVRRFRSIANPWTYVSNAIERTYPRGMDFEVFGAQALREGAAHATRAFEREHVTPILYGGRLPRVRVHHVRRAEDASALRITLDTSEDFELIRRLVEEHEGGTSGVEQLIRVLEENPELSKLNEHVEQKKLDG